MSNPQKGRTSPARKIHAIGYSMAGPSFTYRSEGAFRQEFWLALLMAPLAFWVGPSGVETAMLIGSLLLVQIVELLNSGIEAAIDRASLEWHDLSERAKDLASAAVLLSLLPCIGIWLAAMWQRLT